MPYCKHCGAKVPLNAMFCRNCGKPTVHNKPAAPQPAPQPAPRPAAPQPAPQPAPRPAAPQPAPQPAPRPAAPQPAPQPAPRPAAPQPAPQPKKPAKKSNKTLLICLLSVVLLAGIGAVLWFFVFDKKDEPKTELAEPTPAPAPEPVVEEPVEEPMKGTQEAPTDADFSNWYIGKAQVKGMPRGAATLSTLDDVQGGWKALFFQDPKNKYGVKAYTLANVVIAGTGSDLTFTIKRHSTRFLTTNEKIDEEKDLDDVFSARWNNGKLNASGAGSLTLTSFWEQDGKQYAIGTFDSPDGIPVSLGMVRPQ